MKKQDCASFKKWRQDAIVRKGKIKICASFDDFVAGATLSFKNHGVEAQNLKSKIVLIWLNGVRTRIKGQNLARIYSFGKSFQKSRLERLKLVTLATSQKPRFYSFF